jgi:hypothetical protein
VFTQKLVSSIGVKRLIGVKRFNKALRMKEIGRGGGDRNDKYLNKACILSALQPPTPANRNKRNKMTDFLPPNHRSKAK